MGATVEHPRLCVGKHGIGELGVKADFGRNPAREFNHHSTSLAVVINELERGIVTLADEDDRLVVLQKRLFLGGQLNLNAERTGRRQHEGASDNAPGNEAVADDTNTPTPWAGQGVILG